MVVRHWSEVFEVMLEDCFGEFAGLVTGGLDGFRQSRRTAAEHAHFADLHRHTHRPTACHQRTSAITSVNHCAVGGGGCN